VTDRSIELEILFPFVIFLPTKFQAPKQLVQSNMGSALNRQQQAKISAVSDIRL